MAEHTINASNEQMKYFPYSGMFHLQRNSFWTAGQDSFTLPPAQNSDLFISLQNTENLQGILNRRRGYSLLNKTVGAAPFTHSYSFRSESKSLRSVVLANASAVTALNEDGSTLLSTLFSVSGGNKVPRMVTSRSFGYFADGAAADYKKWDGTASSSTGASAKLTKWGIDINDNTAGTVFGPNSTGTVADQGSGGTSANQGPFASQTCSNVVFSATSNKWTQQNGFSALAGNELQTAGDGLIAVADVNDNGGLGDDNSTDYLYAQNLSGFAIPSTATLAGIQVDASVTCAFGTIVDDGIFLINASNTLVGTDHSDGSTWNITTFATKTWGGSTDTWSAGLAYTDINSSNFGAAIRAKSNSPIGANDQPIVDYLQITVWYTIPGSTSWSPTNALASSATASVSPSSELRCTNYGFTTVSGAITGIRVTITCSMTGGGVGTTIQPILVKAGTAVYARKSQLVPGASTALVFGGSIDLWSGVWVAGDFNSVSTFGTQFLVQTSSGSSTVTVSAVTITIFTLAGPITVTPGGASSGVITLQSGRTYFIVFQNSVDGTTSSLNSASASTGPLTNQDVVLTGIIVPNDTQVDQKLILATADGNDTTKLYLLASIPAATTSYTDNTADTTLVNQPVYQETQADGSLHGVANNNPPTGGVNFTQLPDFIVKHKGRIYGAIGNTLVFSKNLTDVTTSTGTITGKWEEAWPFTNQIDLSETAETVQGMLSDGETLWIGTERSIRRLVGDSPSNFQLPEIQFNEAGLLNMEVWRVIFLEDMPVGTMWMTPDFKVMASDFNTYQDVGTPIQDVLNSINPAAVKTCHASFVARGPAYYFMLYIPTGGATMPNTVCVYSITNKTWAIWTPTDSISTSLFFIDVAGVPRWWFATSLVSSHSIVYEWKPGLFQDRVGNTPVGYSVTAKTSWLDFGDPVLRKSLNQMIIGTLDDSLTLTVEGALTDVDLDTIPDSIQTAIGHSTGPLGDEFVPLAATPSFHRWYRFTFSSPSSSVATDVLDFYNVETQPLLRL